MLNVKFHYSRLSQNWSNYKRTMRPGLPIVAGLLLSALMLTAEPSSAAQDTVVPQTALSPCSAIAVVEHREIPAGTGIAVSADGRWLAEYVHTNRGAEIQLYARGDAAAQPPQERKIRLDPATLPPGINWRILEAEFSADSTMLLVRSTGALAVIDVAAGQLRTAIAYDREKQTYPGQFSVAAGTLAVVFWPPESYLAEAKAKKPVEVRLMDAASGRWLRSLMLKLESSDQWTEIALSPDASRLAVLLRARRWPSKALLAVYATDSGQQIWKDKVSAEDLRWSNDGRELIVLGGELLWLDAQTGKERRKGERELGSSEYHKLRVSAEANAAIGHFLRYSKWKRAVSLGDQKDAVIAIWQLDSGKALCETPLSPAVSADIWPTAQGQLIALEEVYEIRPQLRLLKSARVVTYRLPGR